MHTDRQMHDVRDERVHVHDVHGDSGVHWVLPGHLRVQDVHGDHELRDSGGIVRLHDLWGRVPTEQGRCASQLHA